jgi:hypothetical protein
LESWREYRRQNVNAKCQIPNVKLNLNAKTQMPTGLIAKDNRPLTKGNRAPTTDHGRKQITAGRIVLRPGSSLTKSRLAPPPLLSHTRRTRRASAGAAGAPALRVNSPPLVGGARGGGPLLYSNVFMGQNTGKLKSGKSEPIAPKGRHPGGALYEICGSGFHFNGPLTTDNGLRP